MARTPLEIKITLPEDGRGETLTVTSLFTLGSETIETSKTAKYHELRHMPPLDAVGVTNTVLGVRQEADHWMVHLGDLTIQTELARIHPESQCRTLEEAIKALDEQALDAIPVAAPINMGATDGRWHVTLLCDAGSERTVHAMPLITLSDHLEEQLQTLTHQRYREIRDACPWLMDEFCRIVGWRSVNYRTINSGRGRVIQLPGGEQPSQVDDKYRHARWLLLAREGAVYPYTPKDMQLSEKTVLRMMSSIICACQEV